MGWVILILDICGIGAYLLWGNTEANFGEPFDHEPPPTATSRPPTTWHRRTSGE